MRSVIVLTTVLFPLLAFGGGTPLPRGLEALGIDVPVSLDMRVSDLDKIRGHVVKSGRFVAITKGNDLLSMELDADRPRVRRIVIALEKDTFGRLVKKASQLYSEGNQYTREKLNEYEAHVWKDKNTRLGLIRAKGGFRLELVDRKQ